MIRKTLLTAIFIISLFGAEARVPYKIKRDTIPLKKTEKSLPIELSEGNVNWVSTAVMNGKLGIFYGSNEKDSVIYLTTSNTHFKNLKTDTITYAKWFKSTDNSCVMPTLYKDSDRFPFFIYSYNAPFKNYIYDKYLNLNNSSKNLSDYFVPQNKIVKIIADDGGTTRAFYIDNRFDKGVVMCISSNDNGTSWNYPEICISDNRMNFKNCTMAMDRKSVLYAVVTDDSNRAFLCKSSNYGKTWSYPTRLSHRLRGCDHSITINRSGVYLLFRSLHRDETNGDYLVWNGTINDLNNGANDGQKVVVMESTTAENYNVQSMKIDHLRGNKYIIYGLMDQDGRRIINSYLFKGRFFL